MRKGAWLDQQEPCLSTPFSFSLPLEHLEDGTCHIELITEAM